MKPRELTCEGIELPIFVNPSEDDWAIFRFSVRHPMYWAIWAPWSGLYFASKHRACVDYEMMEQHNEMSPEDFRSQRVGRAWKYLVLHIYAMTRMRIKYWFMFGMWRETWILKKWRRLTRRVPPLNKST